MNDDLLDELSFLLEGEDALPQVLAEAEAMLEDVRENLAREDHKRKILDVVRDLCHAEAAGNIRKAQGRYDYLRGYCESAGVDFVNALEGAKRYLLKRACGILDSRAYGG
jgi:hypothetical protein